MTANRTRAKGFTLLELIVVIAILALLAGILTPIAKSAIDDARGAKISAVVDALSKASQKYYVDTNAVAREYSNSTATADRRLTLQPAGVTGWKGPYLDKPLRDADNPFGAPIRLLDDLNQATPGAAGFDLLGTGTPNHTGTGAAVQIDAVPQNIAQIVNDTLDRGVPGDWMTTGSIEYDATAQRLWVYVHDTDNS
jgi:general secretion pathway protein G